MKTCSKCHVGKPPEEFWRHPYGANGLTSSCKACHREAAARWRANNPEKQRIKTERKRIHSQSEPREVKRERQIKNKYGIGLAEWDAMFKSQSGCCAICNRHQSSLKTVLQVDHDHVSGVVRGLLCTKCNTKLAVVEEPGFFGKADAYLRRSRIKIAEA